MFINLSRPGFWARQDMPDDGDEWIGYDRMVQIIKEHNDRQARAEKDGPILFHELENRAEAWHHAKFGFCLASPPDTYRKLLEEVGELGAAIIKVDRVNFEEELGDCVMLLMHLARCAFYAKGLLVPTLKAVDKCERRLAEEKRRKAFTNPALGVPLSVEEWVNQPFTLNPLAAAAAQRGKNMTTLDAVLEQAAELAAPRVRHGKDADVPLDGCDHDWRYASLWTKPGFESRARCQKCDGRKWDPVAPNVTTDPTGEGSAYMGEPTSVAPDASKGMCHVVKRLCTTEGEIAETECGHHFVRPWPSEKGFSDSWPICPGCGKILCDGAPARGDSEPARLPGAAGLAEKVQEIQAGAATAKKPLLDDLIRSSLSQGPETHVHMLAARIRELEAQVRDLNFWAGYLKS